MPITCTAKSSYVCARRRGWGLLALAVATGPGRDAMAAQVELVREPEQLRSSHRRSLYFISVSHYEGTRNLSAGPALLLLAFHVVKV